MSPSFFGSNKSLSGKARLFPHPISEYEKDAAFEKSCSYPNPGTDASLSPLWSSALTLQSFREMPFAILATGLTQTHTLAQNAHQHGPTAMKVLGMLAALHPKIKAHFPYRVALLPGMG